MSDQRAVSSGDEAMVEELLAELQKLRGQVTAQREELAPLEKNLADAYEQYQRAIGQLRREAAKIQEEINGLRIRMRGEAHVDAPAEIPADTQHKPSAAPQDPEELDKEMLLRHVFLVLEPDVDQDDGELFGRLADMVKTPGTRLADVLEAVTWGRAWTARAPHENPAAQVKRLLAWREAIMAQLEELKHEADRLRRDQRYVLWQRLQEGPDAWQTFLAAAEAQQRTVNQRLQQDLNILREQWQEMVRKS